MIDQQETTVLLLGTLDTKGTEYSFVRDRLLANGLSTIVVDAGVLGPSGLKADISRDEVAAADGTTLAELMSDHDRGAAVSRMAAGAARIVDRLQAEHRFAGALALGGTGGTSIAAHALQSVPIGVPKIIVSTVAAGNTTPYIGSSDLVLFPSVVDIAGINRVSAMILTNAANALTGMITNSRSAPAVGTRPVVGASMFGVTTPCIDTARRLLDQDHEVLVFHMTGVGGRSLERLITEGLIDAVLDVTTTELADELVGGVFSAGPARLTGAARKGIPQVVSVGALDMVNFGTMDSVPERFRSRRLLVHNQTVTLMRTTPAECSELGKRLAERVSASAGPATVLLPLRGISAVSTQDGPFHDQEADSALFDAIRAHLHSSVDLVEIDTDINDPAFAETATRILTDYLTAGR